MPPKKADARNPPLDKGGTIYPSKQTATRVHVGTISSANEDQPKAKSTVKRKQRTGVEGPQKVPRRSARGAQRPEVPPEKLLSFLLSKSCTDLCRPKDEKDAGASFRTYTSTVPLSPFEELLSAIILSRPISHALGQRSIRTILNSPYNFRSPKAIRDAGSEKTHQAMLDAKTQHKQKTAEQIVTFSDTVIEKFADEPEDTSLEKLRKEAEYDRDVIRETITNSFKGIGRTGADIFLRRIQGLWVECYPYIDDRTAKGLEQLGLPTYEEPLQKHVDEHWKQLQLDDIGGKDEEERKRMVFVRLLERALSSDLEGKTDDVLEQAVKT